MLICFSCIVLLDGYHSDVYTAGWGCLRFQHNADGRFICYCPVHRRDAFEEIRRVVQKVLTIPPNEGSQHARAELSP